MPDIEKQKRFRIAPNYINVYYNLANLIKLDSNRLEEAIKVINYDVTLCCDIDHSCMILPWGWKLTLLKCTLTKQMHSCSWTGGQGSVNTICIMYLHRTEEAKMSYEKAVYYDPNYVDAYYNVIMHLIAEPQ